uniref:testisin-like n=1 Tax=Panthera onca TaxID=9690 RepID=UPI0029559AF4
GFENSSLLTWPCGRRTVSTTRVVGGKDSELGRWPWQGSLRLWGAHHCGASLLNRRWVLSAAHCFGKHKDPSKWTAQFGELSSRPTSWKLWTFYHRYRVKDIVVYPQLSGTSLKDIALLKLSSSVTYNKYIQPICVVASSSEFQNKADCWVTGWGHIEEGQGEAGGRGGWGRGAAGSSVCSVLSGFSSPHLGLCAAGSLLGAAQQCLPPPTPCQGRTSCPYTPFPLPSRDCEPDAT